MRLLPLALALLAVPPHTHVAGAGEIAAGRGYPQQVAIVTVGPRPDQRGRVAVWDRGRNGWYRVLSIPVQWVEFARVTEGDPNGDGRRDFLVDLQNGGSGGCGPRYVLGIVSGRTRRLFARSFCDTQLTMRGHSIVLDAGDYRADNAHCCPTFDRRTAFGWVRGEFRPVARELYWNGLSGARDWGRRRIHGFRPHHAVYWRGGIGLAVGGRLPWLLGRTIDGGRTWRIVNGFAFPVGPPRITGPRSASVAVRRCVSAGCRRVATITTGSRGSAWNYLAYLGYVWRLAR